MTRRRSVNASISLTPMIDVMTVLLAVFMVTAPMMTTGINLDLPKGGNSSLNSSDSSVQISVDNKGRYYLLDSQALPDDIVQRLIAMKKENKDLTIIISGDTKADYGAVMFIMGKLKDAGFQKVGLKTKPTK